MAALTNAEIAAALEEIADILDFQGANPFRVRAYRNAARTVGEMTESVADLVESGKADLSTLPGIGSDLAEKIATLARTGTLPLLEELRSQVPEGVLDLLKIPGLGPKRAAALYRQLGITNLEELRQACQEHRVCKLKGFGEKTEAAILEGLDLAAQATQRMYWAVADQIAQSILQHMRSCKGIRKMEFAGSYRRGKETVGDLDLLVVADNPQAAMDHFGRFPGIEKVLARGETKMSVRLQIGTQVDLRSVPEESFGRSVAVFHRFQRAQHRATRPGEGPWAKSQRIRRLPRREANCRPNRGGSLRRTWPAVDSARAAGSTRGVRLGRLRQSAHPGGACRSPGRSSRPQHVDRWHGFDRGNGPGGQGTRP